MPDGNFSNINPPPPLGFGPTIPPPQPATPLWPTRSRPEMLTDPYRVFLADPEGNLIGFDTSWGRASPLARIVYAQRNSTRST